MLHVPRAPDEIDPDTPLFGTGLRLDSIDAVELWISVSVEFGFHPPEDVRRLTAMRTLNTLADLVLAERPPGAA
jgi:acyl carrier protein